MPSIRQRLIRWRKDKDSKATAQRGAGLAIAKELELATAAQISFPPSNSIGAQEALDEFTGDKLAEDDHNLLGDSLDDWTAGGSILNSGDLAGFTV
jgi:hypothetical protein